MVILAGRKYNKCNKSGMELTTVQAGCDNL